MRKIRSTYRIIAAALLIAFANIQVLQFMHSAHSSLSSVEQVQESSQFSNNADISCLICYYLQHSQTHQIYHSKTDFSLYYQAKATPLYVSNAQEALLLFISIRNNKSPPKALSFS